MVDLGVFSQCASAECTGGLILVTASLSGQDYHLYINFMELNAITHPQEYPILDQVALRDKFEHSMVFTTLDLQVGFYNMKVEKKHKGNTRNGHTQ